MKQKLKKLKQVFAITSAGILLFGCQAEEELTNTALHEQKGVIMHKKFEELIQETQFKAVFDKINQSKKGSSHKGGVTSKTVMENRYGFTIVDYPANVVKSNAITSYTFLVKQDSTAINHTVNLIVNLKDNQEPTAYLYEFENATSIGTNNPVKKNGFKKLTKIIYNPDQAQGLGDGECEYVIGWECNGSGHHSEWVDGCTGSATYDVVCAAGGSGGSASSSGPGGGNSSSGYGSNASNGVVNTGTPAVVMAYVGPPLVDPAKDPCTKVQKIKDNAPTVSAELQTLGNKRTEAVEHGLYKLDNSPTFTPIVGTSEAINLPDAPTGLQFTVLGHTHNSPSNKTYSIYSYSDFQLIVERLTLGQIAPDCIITLATADGTNYAMTIDDQAAFLQFFAQPHDSNFDLQSYFDLDKVIDKVYGLNELSPVPQIKVNSTDLVGDEIAFINMLADYNMGASLMEANATFTTFTKVSYDTKKKIIIRQPCN